MDKPPGGLVGPRVGEEIRCPSCARLLVLRSGPAVTAHYAHRPRQSCRNRPGRPRSSPIRLEQLTLFELEPPPRRDPPADPSGRPGAEHPAVRPRRPRRRAWLPRLIRWVRAHRR